MFFKILPKKTSDRRLDTNAKWLLSHRSVLAKIIQYGVSEFHGCDIYEIIDAIPQESIKMGKVTVDSDFAKLSSNEITRLNEKPITFDVFFRETKYEMMIDIEPQNNYNMCYSLIKRGIYYLARMLSSQLMPKRSTNYDSLKKCYSIWLCFDTLFEINSEAAGEYHYGFRKISGGKTSEQDDRNSDLMELVILRAGGSTEIKGECLLDFINSLFRDVDKVDKYLPETEDKSIIEEEASKMCDIVEIAKKSAREEGIKEGIKEGMVKGIKRGRALQSKESNEKILYNSIALLDENDISESQIIASVSKRYNLPKDKVKAAYLKYIRTKH